MSIELAPGEPKPCVFIHVNHKQILGAHVGERALRHFSKNNDKFDVKFIETKDHPDRLESQCLCDSLLQALLIGWGAEANRVGELIRAIRSTGIASAPITADDLVQVAAIENA